MAVVQKVVNMQAISEALVLPLHTEAPLVEEEEEVKTDRVIWFVVAIWVLLALGATIIIGALVWCFIHATHSLYAVFSVNPWEFKVGCN